MSVEINTANLQPSDKDLRLIGVDYIRLCSAFMVVIFHYLYWVWMEPASNIGLAAVVGPFPRLVGLAPYASWGWVGVDIFFVISGLVITESANNSSAFKFFRGRFLRLLPAMLFFATLTFVITAIYSSIGLKENFILWVKSITLFPIGPWLDGSYWTLTVELVFYVVIYTFLAFKKFETIERCTQWAVVAFLLLFGAGLLSKLHILTGPAGALVSSIIDDYKYRVILLTTGPFFGLGICLYYTYKKGITRIRGLALAAYAFVGALAIWLHASDNEAVVQFGCSPLTPVAVWLLAVTTIAVSMVYNKRLHSVPWIAQKGRTLALMTYPIYLCHSIVGGFLLGHLIKLGVPAVLAVVITIICVALFANFFAQKIEPFIRERLKNAFDWTFNWRQANSREKHGA